MAGKRIDANQNEVVRTLRDLGCHVATTSMVGKGFPDLVVSHLGVMVYVEIKDGSKPPSKRKLTPDERRFHGQWEHLPVFVVNDVEEAFFAVGISTDEPPF